MKPKKKNLGLIIAIPVTILVTAVVTALLVTGRVGDRAAKPEASPDQTQTSVESTDRPENSSKPSVSIQETISGGESAGDTRETFVNALIETETEALSEEEKLSLIDFNNRLFSPVYDPVISLTTEGGLVSGEETAAPWTCVVSPDSDQKRAFAIHVDQAVSASRIVWQVSLYPMDGGPAQGGDKPGGLLLEGEVSGTASSFVVDFSAVYAAEKEFFHPAASNHGLFIAANPAFHMIQLADATAALDTQETIPLRTYYVRAYPADSEGNSLADCGTGLPVLYGDPIPVQSSGSLISQFSLRFSLMPARGQGMVSHRGEFPNDFWDAAEVTMYQSGTKTYAVLPSGFPAGTQKLLLQVSLSEFAGNDWNNLSGLVYETSLSPDDPVYQGLSDSDTLGIDLDFSEFVPADSALPEDQYIRYYVRAVALTDGVQPGTAKASYSETVVINYGVYQSGDFKYYPEVKISPEVPVVEGLQFTPIHWETPGWQYHYVVTRQPTEKEVFMGVTGSDSPYAGFPVGTKIDFTPQPEDKSWWEEAWDAITDFFASLKDFAAKLVNWVSSAYADLKSGVINIAVSALPESFQGPMRTALTAMVDYGLASVGIPPTLPNFDELANMGTDYLATVAMEQAGIPADSLLEYGVEELGEHIGEELTSSADAASPNPMNWDFVQLDPDYLYRPAYMTVELYNPYDEPTPEGKLSLRVDQFMDMSQNGFDPTITRLFALYGSSYVCLFKPVYGMHIPSLAPGQRMTVPVILEPYVDIPLPGCAMPVSTEGFAHMYGLGAYDFSLMITYDLPPVSETAAKQGHTEEAIYSYTSQGTAFSFSLDPYDSYSFAGA